MIKRNICDDADYRLDNVSSIQAPTHAHLENRDIQLPAREVLECHSGQHLEEAGMPRQIALYHQPFGGTVYQIVQKGEIVVTNLFAVDLDAFVDPRQVRRRIEGNAQV